MNDKKLFTGGEPNMNENDFMRVQIANREFIQNLFKDYGETIVSGADCVDPGAGNSLTITIDGYVYLDGEILKVDAGIYSVVSTNAYWKYVKSTSYEAGGNKTFNDGSPRQTWKKNRAIPTSVSSIAAGELDCVNGQRYNKPFEWTEPTALETDWILQPGAELEYKKDQFGVVWISGGFRKTTAGSGSATVLTLPIGFRPSKATYCSTNGIPVSDAYITSGGAIIIDAPDHTNTIFITASFRTD